MKIDDIKDIPNITENDKKFLDFCYDLVHHQKLPDGWESFDYSHTLNNINFFHAFAYCKNREAWEKAFPVIQKKIGVKKILEFLLMKQEKPTLGVPLDKLCAKNLECAAYLIEILPKNIILKKYLRGDTSEKNKFSLTPEAFSFWEAYCFRAMSLKNLHKAEYITIGFEAGLKIKDINNSNVLENYGDDLKILEEFYLIKKNNLNKNIKKMSML